MATLLLIRHGQASYGQADYDRLSPRGAEQARVLGEHLRAARIDTLFVGPLRRQVQTAALAGEAAGGALPAPTTLAELAEYPALEIVQQFMPKLVAEDPKLAALATERSDQEAGALGSVTRGPTRELADAAFKTAIGRWSRDEWAVDGVERVTAFAERVRTGLEHAIAGARSGARIAMVTSAGPIGVAVGLAFGASAHHMVRTSIVIRNASITELVFRTSDFAWHPERVSLVGFNSTHHLPAELHTEY